MHWCSLQQVVHAACLCTKTTVRLCEGWPLFYGLQAKLSKGILQLLWCAEASLTARDMWRSSNQIQLWVATMPLWASLTLKACLCSTNRVCTVRVLRSSHCGVNWVTRVAPLLSLQVSRAGCLPACLPTAHSQCQALTHIYSSGYQALHTHTHIHFAR